MKKLLLSSFALASIFSFAYTQVDISNATYLAEQNIIIKQSDEMKYRLDNTITRAEMIGIALKIKGTALPESYTCKNYFSDVKYDKKNNWICRAVELAADDKIVSKSNKRFRPQDTITRAESLAILMSAMNIPKFDGYDYELRNYVDIDTWQLGVVKGAINNGIIGKDDLQIKQDGVCRPKRDDVTCEEIYFYPNRPATRAEIFGYAKKILAPQVGKAYKNQDMGFQITYPTNYALVESNELPSSNIMIDSSEAQKKAIYITNDLDLFSCCDSVYLSVEILDTTTNDFQKWIEENFESRVQPYGESYETENISFAGEVAIKNTHTFGDRDFSEHLILLNHKGQTYKIRYADEKYFPKVEAIVSSFKFID